MEARRKRTDGSPQGLGSARAAAIALAAFLSIGAPGEVAQGRAEDDRAAPQVSPGARQQGMTPEAHEAAVLLREVVEGYARESSCRLSFEQSNVWALADSTCVTRGTLCLSRPSRVSVTYEDGGRIVVREDSVWVYVPATHQFFVAPADSADIALDPADLLGSYEPDPARPFLAVGGEGVAPTLRRLSLVPRAGATGASRLEAVIDEREKLVRELKASWTSGDTVTYSITETRFGVQIDAEEFTIARPPGSRLVREMP